MFFKKKIKKERRSFTTTQKTFIWYRQEWICKECESTLDMRTVKYDHIKRYSQWWNTNIENWQALCANCHSRKTFDENIMLIDN